MAHGKTLKPFFTLLFPPSAISVRPRYAVKLRFCTNREKLILFGGGQVDMVGAFGREDRGLNSSTACQLP